MPDALGRKEFKIKPPGDSNSVQDVLDEVYSVLFRRGYAITQGNWGGQALLVLCRQPEPGTLEPVAHVAQIIPGKGIDWRAVGGAKPEVSIQ